MRSDGGEAAVDDQLLAGDEGGVVGGEECDGRRDFFGETGSRHGGLVDEALREALMVASGPTSVPSSNGSPNAEL